MDHRDDLAVTTHTPENVTFGTGIDDRITNLTIQVSEPDCQPGAIFEFTIEKELDGRFGVYATTLAPRDAEGLRGLVPHLLGHVSRDDLLNLAHAKRLPLEDAELDE